MTEMLSLIVRYQYDVQTDSMQLQIVNVDTGKEVNLNQGSFLLRIFTTPDGLVQRCFIRHIASGREAYVQGGPNLRTFVKACILQSPTSLSASASPENPPESSTPAGPEEDAET